MVNQLSLGVLNKGGICHESWARFVRFDLFDHKLNDPGQNSWRLDRNYQGAGK